MSHSNKGFNVIDSEIKSFNLGELKCSMIAISVEQNQHSERWIQIKVNEGSSRPQRSKTLWLPLENGRGISFDSFEDRETVCIGDLSFGKWVFLRRTKRDDG
jgi:hypothetical protein